MNKKKTYISREKMNNKKRSSKSKTKQKIFNNNSMKDVEKGHPIETG